MPRKQKIYVRPMEDAMMKGGSAIPPQVLIENKKKFGGAICAVCKHHIDMIESESDSDDEPEIEGGAMLVNVAEKVEKLAGKTKRGATRVAKETGKYVTSKQADSGLASDLLTYGLPAATATTLGAVGALGGPLTGIAASAIGSKVGALAGEKIKGEVLKGGAVKRKSRFEKGSEAAKEHMKKIREMRKKKE